jgi:di/tricarboxylate transporter
MTFDQAALIVVLATAVTLFISERFRYDLVALATLLVCVLLGLVEPGVAFAGFANDAVVTVAAVLVMSHALARSGAVDVVTVPLLKLAPHPLALLGGLCVIGALLSSFMNNVGALALLMPVAIAGARKGDYSVGLLLMPLSFATLLGGTTTLIGTPPNLLMADLAERLRGEPFTMFDYTPVGATISIAGIVFMVAIGWRFLPQRHEAAKSPTELFDIGHYVTEARLPPKSSLIGKTIREFEDASGDRAVVLALVHGDTRLRPGSSYVLQEGDVLLLQAETEALQEFVKAARIALVAAAPRDQPDLPSAEAAVPMASEPAGEAKRTVPTPARQLLDTAEAVVTPTSWMQGSTARTLRLRARYDTNLLAISRRGRPVTTRLRDVPLFAGDVLLLEGPADDLPDVITKLGCLPLADRKLGLSPRRVFLPFAVFLAAVALVMSGVASAAIAFVIGATAMVALGFLPAREVYSTIEWPVIILLAALIPVAGALETTGAAALAADALVAAAGNLPAHAILGLLLIATMAITPILNNAATVLLMGPIAHGVAENIGIDSAAFLMAVAIGASCDFLTPFGHQNNTLILGPGGYRFADFWKVGLPIDAIVLAVAVPLLPIVFPFD